MDVGVWLRSLDLGQYEESFRDNKIQADILWRLTANDLKDIGVSTVGDRLRLFAAIDALTGATPASRAKPAPSKRSQVSAERRPITVLFCDLVGSTALASQLDAEDWRSLVNAYLDAASAAVAGLGGHVLKRLGDGLMALFGYPSAQENDAERAVRAALAIQRALSEINASNAARGAPRLSARIGLESGPVVVESAGEVFGDAPNIAARVQALAEPGSALITRSVLRQVAGLFIVEELGARELKGVSEPVQLFRIVREGCRGRRGAGRTLAPFVGREEELDLLTRRWERARAGEGQFVLIVGEAGLGKSRLIEEFHARLAETRHTWSEWNASQLLQNTPLHPLAEWARQRFGGADAPADKRFAELEIALRQVKIDADETAPLLAPLLEIPLPLARAAQLAPEETRRRQLASLVSWTLAAARAQPLVLVFQDLHWADPTTIEAFRALAERVTEAPLLLVATTRPEFRPSWTLLSHHSVISLRPLDRADVALMVGGLVARRALGEDVIEGVSKRTGGVPLFVEEVTRLLLERGEQGGLQAIPPTLQQLLTARLDRLGEAREAAQIGAVLGRDFSFTLLAAVATVADPVLQSALDRLVDADLLLVEGAGAQATYRFKHALIQHAAYESLLKSRRRALHRRAAESLRDEPERAAGEPEVVAHHFTEAGLDDLAIEWWGKAGDQALRRSAFQEAIAHLGKAIAMSDRAGDGTTAAPSGQRLKLQTDYGDAVRGSKGFAATRTGAAFGGADERTPASADERLQAHRARFLVKTEAARRERRARFALNMATALLHGRGMPAPETRAAFERAENIAVEVGDPIERLAILCGKWAGGLVSGDVPRMLKIATSMESVAAREETGQGAVVARRVLGVSQFFAGDLARADENMQWVVDHYDFDRDHELAVRFAHDHGVAARNYLAFAKWLLGDGDAAFRLVGEAKRLAGRLGHAPSSAAAYAIPAWLDNVRGDHIRARRNAEAALALARDFDLPFWRVNAEFHLAWAKAASEGTRAAWNEAEAALSSLSAQGAAPEPTVPCVGAGFAALGDLDRAFALVDQALSAQVERGAPVFLPETHRVRGEILSLRNPGDPAPAEEAFQTAIAIAREQGSRAFGVRAALSLAKLYQSTGRSLEAHEALAPALEGFSPTPELPAIAEAQALLGELKRS
jgi:class 3 adenylate cyclase/tetratricopeptide (TPR) repeat protein